jgi:hypothetical protein
MRQTQAAAPFTASMPSPSSAILGNRPEPTIDPSFPYQSALYAPSTLAHIQANQQVQAQAQAQAVQAAQAAYAAEVDSLRRRSLDSATQALYNRILSQQLEVASQARRSFDVRPRHGHQLTQLQSLQSMYSSEFPMGALPQQQQQQRPSFEDIQQQHQRASLEAMHQQQQRASLEVMPPSQGDQAGSDEAEQLLRSAFTSASQELSSEEDLASNLDMYMMVSDLQQQAQQQQQQQ